MKQRLCHPALWIVLACLGCSSETSPTRGSARSGATGPMDTASAAVEERDAAAGDVASPCVPGATRCTPDGRRVEICIGDDRWVDKEGCASTCTEGLCTGNCLEGERRCGRRQRPEVCTRAGDWSREASCEFVCVGDGVCSGECKPGDTRCGGADDRTPQSCGPDGRWSAGEACPFLCSSGSCAGSCTPGARRCGVDQRPELCSAMGTWEPQDACPFICRGDGECGGECRPGDGACEGNTTRSCGDDGMWDTGRECKGQACVEGECIGECEPGGRMCRGDALATCDARGRYEDDDCPARCSGGRCVDCLSDSDCAQDALCQEQRCVTIACFGPPINGQGTGAACCDSRCGAATFELSMAEDPDGLSPESKGCGQPNCGRSRAGPEGCCTGTIRTSGRSCKEKRSAPCWLEQ